MKTEIPRQTRKMDNWFLNFSLRLFRASPMNPIRSGVAGTSAGLYLFSMLWVLSIAMAYFSTRSLTLFSTSIVTVVSWISTTLP